MARPNIAVQLARLIWRRHLPALVLAALISLTLAGCSDTFNRTIAWEEEVLVSGGSVVRVSRSITRGPDQWFRPGRGGIQKSTLTAMASPPGKIEFTWTGHELPVAFDIVDGIAWVVLPIAGLNSCQKYGNPAESVVAFSLQDGRWQWRSFDQAPPGLKQNVLRAPPFGLQDNALVKVDSKNRFDRNAGMELRKGFIAQHVKWSHACHRINPPPDPSYQRGLREYAEKPRIALSAKVLEQKDDTLGLTREENLALMGPLSPEGKQGILGCEGKVDRQESIFTTRRTESGGSSGTLTAYRIVLAAAGAAAPSIFLPAYPAKQFVSLARIACSGPIIYVLLQESRDSLGIVAYDVEGNWRAAWRLSTAALDFPEKRWGRVIGFEDRGDRFLLSIGEYRHNSGQSNLPAATLGKRYVIEALKPADAPASRS